MAVRVGADVGGTFTDFCLFDSHQSSLNILKVPTTQPDPSEGIIAGLLSLIDDHQRKRIKLDFFGHGTTLATNMLLEGKGARTALVTTEGFRDLLELRREKRPRLYDLQSDKPSPLVNRRLRFEVSERSLANGTIVIEPDPERVREIARALAAGKVEAVAVIFLHSYRNPRNERIVKEILSDAIPGVYICSSSEVASEFREFERLSTTVVNAFLGPSVSTYLTNFRERIESLGLHTHAYVLQSDGGIVPLSADGIMPARLLASGPSAGVAGAVYIAERCGINDLITIDMGGTSTDVSIVERGRPRLINEREVAGWPIKVPALDVVSVGAGGGSIAYVDSGGHLKVGPESAGSSPGPAAYGKGGDLPTVTDAHVVLGSLNPQQRLGGSILIDRELASRAIRERVARPLGITLEQAAQAIVTIAVSVTVQAIRLVSVRRGYDPRDFTLVAFGGAGPLHAGYIMRELSIRETLIPRYPGVVAALGVLTSDVRMSFRRTRILHALSESAAQIGVVFSELDEQAKEWASRYGLTVRQSSLERSVDMRYRGQNYELAVPVATGKLRIKMDSLVSRFQQEHERTYGYRFVDAAAELVTMCVTVRIPSLKLPLERMIAQTAPCKRIETRLVHFPGDGYVSTPIYRRNDLSPGVELRGPAIVEQTDSTTMILGGQEARVDEWGNLRLAG